MKGRCRLAQSSGQPCSLKKIVRVEWCGQNTVSETWIGISEGERLCRSSLVGIPIRKIARQCSYACQEMWTKKRRTPSSNDAVAEKLPQDEIRGRNCDSRFILNAGEIGRPHKGKLLGRKFSATYLNSRPSATSCLFAHALGPAPSAKGTASRRREGRGAP